jgi:hypothetical protein
MLSVRIFSMMGAEVASLPKQVLELGEWDMRLNLTGVESGIYFCEVRSEGGTQNSSQNSAEARWTGLIRIVR